MDEIGVHGAGLEVAHNLEIVRVEDIHSVAELVGDDNALLILRHGESGGPFSDLGLGHFGELVDFVVILELDDVS